MGKRIRIGTSGFQFDDWKGTIYPPNISNQDMLSYYEKELGFDTVEVNFTYYRLPSSRALEGMMRKTSDDFEFVVRSHKEMTHEIWEDDQRKSLKENEEIFIRFKEGVKPLKEAGRLGCILIQFPSFFWPKRENFDYILTCKERLKEIPLVVEFRNRNWVNERTFSFLKAQNLGFCVVDEPKLPRLMPFTPKVTSDVGYMRFHGRNVNWFKASREERYNYLYTPNQLESFLPSIRNIVQSSEKAFIFFNNCHAGHAVKNSLYLKRLMGLIDELTPEQERIFSLIEENDLAKIIH